MSAHFTPANIASWCDGTLVQGDPNTQLLGLSIDTRTVRDGQLFAAIVGPNHDAHAYLAEATSAGASALLIAKGREDSISSEIAIPVIAVADTTRGIQDLAAAHRQRFAGTVVGLTGSSGKTTTKEMTASVLSTAGPCLKTQGNLNNEYGVPLTLLSREDTHTRAVVEMGMNHRGEIARLAEIAKPDIALVTNVGTAHIEYLGSQTEIAAEKGDLFAALGASGIAVANWDDKNVREQSARAPAEVISFGMSPDACVRASDVRFADDGFYEFTLTAPAGSTSVRIGGLGDTTIINALAAAAVGVACELSLDQIANGLADYEGIAGRMSKKAIAGDITLIDDTYNANPQSMQAAIASVASLASKGRAIAVLGAMAELGDNAAQAHLDTGKQVFKTGVSLLVAVGKRAAGIAEGAIAAGMAKENVKRVEGPEAACNALKSELQPGDWVLVKGSRAARMERIVETLCSEEPR
ncbi:MAG: UDP-N-acetylmuramoyl-tripeptide--D-alanyl-D-alanine ligase [Myxococcota bacterium]|jgi:UDP-N-acetylmuramoyl-tripeptide--D-alanyl-D-alanine ligase